MRRDVPFPDFRVLERRAVVSQPARGRLGDRMSIVEGSTGSKFRKFEGSEYAQVRSREAPEYQQQGA